MTSHCQHYRTLAAVLVVVIPLGVPLVALAVLLRASRAHRVANAAQVEQLDEALAPLPEQGSEQGLEEAEEAFVHAQLTARCGPAFPVLSLYGRVHMSNTTAEG